ncbi:MAG: hypothetical protein HN623_10860 [Bdellovibrionales bacterium]|nr:hypothetical protein [Bdellovibrionales bacterium]
MREPEQAIDLLNNDAPWGEVPGLRTVLAPGANLHTGIVVVGQRLSREGLTQDQMTFEQTGGETSGFDIYFKLRREMGGSIKSYSEIHQIGDGVRAQWSLVNNDMHSVWVPMILLSGDNNHSKLETLNASRARSLRWGLLMEPRRTANGLRFERNSLLGEGYDKQALALTPWYVHDSLRFASAVTKAFINLVAV